MNATVAVSPAATAEASTVSRAVPSTESRTGKVSGVSASPSLLILTSTSTVSYWEGSSRETLTLTRVRSGRGFSDVALAVALFWIPPGAETIRAWLPNLSPRVHSVMASPFSSVSDVPALTDPLFVAGLKVSVTPATPNPPRSSARATTGSSRVSPLGPSCPSPETTLTKAARCCTVTDAVAFSPPEEACRVPDPFPAAVTCPLAPTVKTASSELDQVTVAVIAAPYWSRTVAVKLVVWEM